MVICNRCGRFSSDEPCAVRVCAPIGGNAHLDQWLTDLCGECLTIVKDELKPYVFEVNNGKAEPKASA